MKILFRGFFPNKMEYTKYCLKMSKVFDKRKKEKK